MSENKVCKDRDQEISIQIQFGTFTSLSLKQNL